MKTKRTHLAEPVSCKYGAPMGRHDYTVNKKGERATHGECGLLAALPLRFRLQVINLDSGGYDRGGAYWGHRSGSRIFFARYEGEHGEVFRTFDAKDRAHALQLLREEFPKAYTYNEPREYWRVVFRKWKNGDVIALFANTYDGHGCDSFEHVGQHGAAHYHEVIAATTPAREPEFAALRRELESSPYFYDVLPVKRANRRRA